MWVTGVNLGNPADWQPCPQQKTFCDVLPHFGSLPSGRVAVCSAHDWKGWANCVDSRPHEPELVLWQLTDMISDSRRQSTTVGVDPGGDFLFDTVVATRSGRDRLRSTIRNIVVDLPPTPTARAVIRQATCDIHERLHDHIAFRQLLAQTITRDEYRALLEALYGFHQPIEAVLVLHAGQQTQVSMEGRGRAHLLLEDLNVFGGGKEVVADLPLASLPLHLLAEPGGFLGCLYVREGAMLGGRVLAGKLDHLLGGRTEGRRFFSGSARDAELWRSCCSAIDHNSGGVELDGMISAARETFEIFERWMTSRST